MLLMATGPDTRCYCNTNPQLQPSLVTPPIVDSFIEYFEAQNEHISIHNWNVLSLDSYRTNNDSEAENCRLGTRITPAIASYLFTFIIGIQNEHCYQSRTLFQFNNGARFALRKKQYRINEEHIAFLVEERERGNLDTLQFLDCIYRRIGD